jgi:hypothetical protein
MHVGAPLGQRIPHTVLGDVAVAVLVVLFGWLALQIHNSVADLGDMARGMRDTGTAIQRSGAATADELRQSVGRAADTAEGVPIVGGDVADAVRDTGRRSADSVQRETRADGARLIESGGQGMEDTRRTARLIGWFTFLVPTVLLLVQWLPQRLGAARARGLG